VGVSWNIPGLDEEVAKLQSTTLEQPQDMVSFVELKQLVVKLFPPTSILRKMILGEPDMMSRTNSIAKMEIYVRLLYSELRDQ
jgi:hypothetical protein